MINHRNIVRVILLLGMISAAKYVNASEQSVFLRGNNVYRLKYTTSIKVAREPIEDSYLTKAYRHSNYLVGQLAYSPRKENGSATGAPLRKRCEDFRREADRC